MSEHHETYYRCDGCGADSRDVTGTLPGNAFVSLAAVNMLTGVDLMPEDTTICANCWCRVQEVAFSFRSAEQARAAGVAVVPHPGEGDGPWNH